MNKSAKSGASLFLVIVGVILLAFAFRSQIGFAVSVNGACSSVLQEQTFGADEGQCFVKVIANQEQVVYVSSVTETSGKCSPSLPWCGIDGTRKTCTVSTITDSNTILTNCQTADTSTGTVKVCKFDSDCPSQNCANHICQEGTPRICSSIGSRQCITGSDYQVCLSNGRWSGNLHCSSGTSCSNGACTTSSGSSSDGS